MWTTTQGPTGLSNLDKHAVPMVAFGRAMTSNARAAVAILAMRFIIANPLACFVRDTAHPN
jgi:hypothetical protein